MAVFNVPRAGRKNTKYMEGLIAKMYNDEKAFWKR